MLRARSPRIHEIRARQQHHSELVLDTGTVRNMEVRFELPMLEWGEKIAPTSYAAAYMQRDQQDLLV